MLQVKPAPFPRETDLHTHDKLYRKQQDTPLRPCNKTANKVGNNVLPLLALMPAHQGEISAMLRQPIAEKICLLSLHHPNQTVIIYTGHCRTHGGLQSEIKNSKSFQHVYRQLQSHPIVTMYLLHIIQAKSCDS